jgi:hypothetical protein
MTTGFFYCSLATVHWFTIWAEDQVIVMPIPIDSVLYNPGIGIEVFHNGTQPASYPASRMVSAGTDGGPYEKVFWPNYNTAFMDAIEHLMVAHSVKMGARDGVKIIS